MSNIPKGREKGPDLNGTYLSNTAARGAVNILTEKAACASCLNVAEQFKAKYPNTQ